MNELYDETSKKNQSFEKRLRRVIFLLMITVSFFFTGIVSIISGKYIYDLSLKLDDMTVQNSADTISKILKRALEDIRLSSRNPVVINSLISYDEETLSFVLSSLQKRILAEFVSIRDSDGLLIFSVDATGRRAYPEMHMGYEHRFRLINVEKDIFEIRDYIDIAVPVKFYMKNQGFIEVVINPEKLFSAYLDTDFLYQFSAQKKSAPDGYLIGAVNFQNPVSDMTSDIIFEQYRSDHPYKKLISVIIYSLIIITCLVFLVSFMIAKNIADYFISPIRKLVALISGSDLRHYTRCSPTGAGLEIEYLAKAFDRRTEQLIENNNSLEQKILERTYEIQKEKERAEKALSIRSEFIANMSHEIRTPLNGILGVGDILAEELKNSDSSGKVKILQQSGELLLSIINDILDFSKLESKQMLVEKVSFNPRSLIKNLMDAFEDQANQKGLHLSLSLLSPLPEQFYGDPTRILQILFNLTGNAVKFTKEGSISVIVSAEQIKSERYFFKISVKDTGIGIQDSMIRSLFNPFYQADGSITRRFGGSGLGLTISKQLAELMGGHIEVESIFQQGTIFTVTLPLELSHEILSDQAMGSHTAFHFKEDIKILLAEDNDVNRELFKAYLSSIGLSCEIAVDGSEAVRMAKNYSYDFIFMDMQMPVMDGITATREIRSLPEHQRTKIIALTANAFNEHRQRCLDAGMDDYLSKPLKKKNLIALIQKMFSESKEES
ncbi:MAG: response regulator [Deltaproteobacteria bacterium]|nr:response regulator [Deltaproteobacteria bacterium]